MPPRPYPITFGPDQQRYLEQVAQSSGWQILSQEVLSFLLPSRRFAEKMDSAVLVCTATSTGGTYLLFNCRRVELRLKAIDQHPFALIVHATGASPQGIILEHGDWIGRTTTWPEGFWAAIQDSGVGNWFLSNPPAGLTSGSLDTLPTGDKTAFEQTISFLRSSSTG